MTLSDAMRNRLAGSSRRAAMSGAGGKSKTPQWGGLQDILIFFSLIAFLPALASGQSQNASQSSSASASTTSNRFATGPAQSTILVPTASGFNSPNNTTNGSSTSISAIIATTIILPLCAIGVVLIVFRKQMVRWMERGSGPGGAAGEAQFRQGAAGVSIPDPAGTGADRPAEHAGNRRRNRRRQPSVRSVPEYSADANDSEIVLARAQHPDSERRLLLRSTSIRTAGTGATMAASSEDNHDMSSPPLNDNVPDSAHAMLPYAMMSHGIMPGDDPPGYESRRGTIRDSTTSTRIRGLTDSAMGRSSPGPAASQYVEIPLGRIVTGPATPNLETDAFPPRPLVQSHRASRSVTSLLSMARTGTMSSSSHDFNGTMNSGPQLQGRRRSSTLLGMLHRFRSPAATSTTSLLPTHSSRESTISLTDDHNTSGRARAGSVSQLRISSPLPESFQASAFEFPRGRPPTEDQMRFLGSAENLSRLGVGSFTNSRTSLHIAAGNGDSAAGAGVGAEEQPPPPPFDASVGIEETGPPEPTSRRPLYLPKYEVTPATPPAVPPAPLTTDAATRGMLDASTAEGEPASEPSPSHSPASSPSTTDVPTSSA